MKGIEGLEPGGNCPVQADGTVDGNPAYFRARGEGWSFAIARPDVDPVGIDAPEDAGALYYREDDWGAWPDAGWMTPEEARAIIDDCVAEYHGGGWPRERAGGLELGLRCLGSMYWWLGRLRPALALRAWRMSAWLTRPLVRWLARRRGAGQNETPGHR